MALPRFAPDTLDGLRDAVAGALADGTRLAVEGRGSKRGLGRPVAADAVLDLSALSGITYYEPGELVMEAMAGTPLAEIEAELAANNQHLAFEPGEVGHLWGAGGGSIGGVFACNLSGPRRPLAGAARDHLLGVAAVSGRGEAFSAGGRVVKNVTGYDMGKLLAGSFGTLSVMGRVTFKVLPRAESERTILLFGLEPGGAIAALAKAGFGPWDISGAAWLPADAAARSAVGYVAGAGASVAAIRLEGARGAVAERCAALRGALSIAPTEELHTHNSRKLWAEMRDGRLIAPGQGPLSSLWRLTLPSADAASVLSTIAERTGGEFSSDWQGGLAWLAIGGDGMDVAEAAAVLRAEAAIAGGHAVLWRATDDARSAISVFGDQGDAISALVRRIKSNFDPAGILNPGRMAPAADSAS